MPTRTLSGRVAGTVFAAFVLVGSVLLAFDFVHFQQAIRGDSGLLRLAGHLSSILGETDEPDFAVAKLQAALELVNLERSGTTEYGLKLLALRSELFDARDGRCLNCLRPAVLPSAPAPMSVHAIGGIDYWVVETSTPRWILRLAEPRLSNTELLWVLVRELLPSLLIALPLVMVPVWLAVRRGMAPLRALATRLRLRAADDLRPLGEASPYAEIRTLAQGFDQLLARLRTRQQRERAFVHDAAHELRTPLAVIAAQAHRLQQAGTVADREEAARALERAVVRAGRLAGQLLTLASLEEAPQAQVARIDVAASLRDSLAQRAAGAMRRRVEITLHAPDSLSWPMEGATWASIHDNLIDNALLHAGDGARVELRLGVQAGELLLQVCDNGPGIAAEQREAVFERFVRGSEARTQGSGLGLAIVRAACTRCGGRIVLDSGPGGVGLQVTVRIAPATAADPDGP